MGRYNFKPHRVHQAVTQLLRTEKLITPPAWYSVLESIPPAQTLVRTQPLQHTEELRRPKRKKPSRLFKPQPITYEEDTLRREFFTDHPWELARPRVVLENDGKDAQLGDWSHIRQRGRPLNGESVVQRQMWLMHYENMSKAQAYDQARQEFYDERLQEDVERQVAKEEALATGAVFGKSWLEIGMEQEDKHYENWRHWALEEIKTAEQMRAAAYTGNAAQLPAVTSVESSAGLDALELQVLTEDLEATDDRTANP